MTEQVRKQRRVLVTGALPYSNNRLHIGHIAGAYVPADIYVRFLRLCGAEVRFICGSDDHGVAIMLSAEKEGKTPAEVSRYYNEKQQRDFGSLGINFDIYGATSRNPYHVKCSQDFFLKLLEKGYLGKQKTRQFYDDSRSMFLPDRFVKGVCGYCGKPDQNGDQCEDCGNALDVDTLKNAYSVVSQTPASIKETVHWFLDLSRCGTEVENWLARATLRDFSRKYVRGLITTGLIKRSMTRDISWGIPVPLSEPDAQGKVLYVWFDAPIGYISNTMQLCAERGGSSEDYAEWWKSPDTEIYHFIGEDNTIFHCLIWIAMLHAEGSYQLPRGVVVNQFLNFQFPGKEVEKMSKSKGTAVWIEDYIASGGNPDSLRYYLTVIAPERARTVFNPEDLVQRHNADLANNLGNFVNRIVSFTHKYCSPAVPECPSEKLTAVDQAFLASIQKTHTEVTKLMEEFSFKSALDTIMEFSRSCNRYVDEKAPWNTRKIDMPATGVTLATALNAIKLLTVTLAPFMPFTAKKMAAQLGLELSQLNWEAAIEPLKAGTPLGKPEILFVKIDKPEGAA